MSELAVGFHSLPPEYQNVICLAQDQHNITITPLQVLVGGWSGAVIYLVSISSTESQRVEHCILKLDHKGKAARSDEVTRHNAVLEKSAPAFAQTHIPELAFARAEHEGALAILYRIAGQSLLRYRPLSSYERQSQLKTIFTQTNHILLQEWNANAPFLQAVHPQKVLGTWLGFRLDAGGNIERFLQDTCRVDPDIAGFIISGHVFPNPLLYGRKQEPWGKVRAMDVLTGFIHGDLNTNNILVKFSENKQDLEGYYLIDFALFKEGMPLLYDQRYLEISYLLQTMSQVSFAKAVNFLMLMAVADIPDHHKVPIEMSGISEVIASARGAFAAWVDKNHPISLQVAQEVLDHFPEGVFFVPLADDTDANQLISRVAQQLEVREGGRPLLENVKDYLRDKRMLLVLDNFEQLISSADVVADLLAAAPQWFWYRRGYLSEGRMCTDRVLASPDMQQDSRFRAMALASNGFMTMWQGEQEKGLAQLQQSLAIVQRLEDEFMMPLLLMGNGVAFINMGRDSTAQPLFDEALPLFDQQNMPYFRILTLVHLGNVELGLRNRERARALHEEARTEALALGENWILSFALNNLGEVARTQGQYEVARYYHEQCEALLRDTGDTGDLARFVHSLGYVAQHEGDFARAESQFRKSLRMLRRLGNRRGIAECLAGLAGLKARQGKVKWGATLFSAGESLLRSTGGAWWPADRVEVEQNREIIKTSLTEEEFAVAWKTGAVMTIDQAIHFANNES